MIHYCFLTGLYSRQDPLITERQGRSLVENGFRVTYIVCDGYKDEVKDGIYIVSTGFEPKNRLQRFLGTKRMVLKKAIDVDADVYQISDPEMISFVNHFQKKGKKVVFNLREYYPDLFLQKKYIPRPFRKLLAKYYSSLMTKYLPKYDAVFTVTPQLVDFLKDVHKVQSVYLLTNYPIPDRTYSLSKDDYLKRPNLILYEGSIYAISRQERVFDALEKIDNIKYVLAGKIEPGYEIKRHPYWSKVVFVDGFKKEDLPGLFGRATISNILRDFGNLDGSLGVIKLFESMEAALPVLLSDVPLYRDLVSRYKCGICVNPNDSVSIKNALLFLINNKEVAYEMGQNGRKAVLSEFNWWEQAKTYLSIINKIYNS